MKNKIELTAEIKYKLLRNISNKIRGTLDLDKILNLLLDMLANVIDYDAAGIFILSEDINHPGYHQTRQKIASMVQRGFGNLPLESDGMLMEGKGIVGQTIKMGKSIILNDVTKDERYIPGRKETRSEITSPILRDGKTIGALNVESDKLAAFDPADIEVLNFFAEASAISIEKALLHYQIIEKKKIEEQLQLAKDVQLSLLPNSEPEIEGYHFASVCIPAYEIGGDYFDYIVLDENRLAIVIADVSGDGVPAALIMAAFRALLRYNAKLFSEPREIMKLMNEQVSEFMRKRDFISVFYGILNHRTHTFTYCNCGHNPALLWDNDTTTLLEGGGPSLNLLKDAEFKSSEITLNKNDQILLYTDGVVEVFSKDKNQFGLDRLIEIFEINTTQSPQKMVDEIISATKYFSTSDIYNDDFTLLLLKRNY
ncbi:MAG: SpoIIE family protein phosphatase [Ignavibacteriales bacterium]|nr:SpoIIE family protein phosphatase [Ignavibacteriales bacterium]